MSIARRSHEVGRARASEALWPTFSIVVPTRNRHQALRSCLASLAALRYPSERFEAIVVDDATAGGVGATVATFRTQLNLKLLRQEAAGPAAARNAGSAVAEGDYLAFTDDDCVAPPGWLEAVARRATSAPGAVICGRTVNALPENAYAEATQLLVDYLYRCHSDGLAPGAFFTSNNVAMPRELFQRVGGFDPEFVLAAGEDRELAHRLESVGSTLVYAQEVVVHHAHPLTFRRFWRQHFGYGRGSFVFHRLGGRNVKLEAPAFYWALVADARRAAGLRRRRLTALIAAAQLANAAGFGYEAVRKIVRL